MPNIFRTLRNNWKKTIFFAIVGYVGTEKATERYRAFMMMRELSEEARSHGRRPLPRGARTKHVTLLVNPVADNRKGRDNFEKYSEPLIHLSGFLVNVVKTEKISEARELVELIDRTNIIGVAGGDGTLMEVVTGLLRREDADEAVRRFPIAVIPVGTHNSFATSILQSQCKLSREAIAQASMNIVRHHIEPEDVIKVELVSLPEAIVVNETKLEDGSIVVLQSENSNEQTPLTSDVVQTEQVSTPDTNTTITDIKSEGLDNVPKKPYYSMHGLQLGRFREAEKREDDMPRFLYRKFRTVWSLFRTPIMKCKAEIRYLPYCDGCSKCKDDRLKPVKQQSFISRIFSVFRPSVYANPKVPGSEHPKWSTLNPNCGIWESLCVDTTELNVLAQGRGKMEIQIGKNFSTLDFVFEGFRRKYKRVFEFSQTIPCQQVEIFPVSTPESYSIDNEDFPAKPIRMQLLRDKVYFFTSPP